jgi:hypothetical protein
MRRMIKAALIAVGMVAGLAAPAQAQAGTAGADVASGQLNAVTCTGASNCWAVGYQATAGLIEQWNGSAWQQVASPDPAKASKATLDGVACAQVTSCWAVGYYSNAKGTEVLPYADYWNGTAWSETALPNPDPGVTLMRAVSCPAANLCFAGGAGALVSHGAEYDASVLERWNGTSWKVVPDPTLPGTPKSGLTITGLQGLSCASADECWASGGWLYDPGPQAEPTKGGALGYQWDGQQWTGVRITDLKYAKAGDLYGISCPAPTMCMAIGAQPGDGHLYPEAEQWNGSSWAAAPIAGPAGPIIYIEGVGCAAAAMCMAVGYSGADPAIYQWNGSSWTSIPAPGQPNVGNELYGVTCTSTDNCWGVGLWAGGGVYGTLIEQWNGTAWTIVPS